MVQKYTKRNCWSKSMNQLTDTKPNNAIYETTVLELRRWPEGTVTTAKKRRNLCPRVSKPLPWSKEATVQNILICCPEDMKIFTKATNVLSDLKSTLQRDKIHLWKLRRCCRETMRMLLEIFENTAQKQWSFRWLKNIVLINNNYKNPISWKIASQ